MVFVPPQFKDFGKEGNDLFSKKYDFANTVKVLTKSSNGVEVESQLFGASGAFAGKSKFTANCPKHGKVELELNSQGSPLLNAKWETSKLVDGFKFTLSGSESLSGKVQADFSRDSMAASATLNVGGGSPSLLVSGAFGIDGVSIGGQAKLDSATSTVSEFGAGWQWQQSDFTGAIVTKTTAKSDTVSASYFVKKAQDSQVGAIFDYDLNKNSSSVSVATQYNMCANTVVKAKASSNGAIHAAVEHVLRDPRAKINLAAEFAVPSWNCVLDTKRFGFGITFGDF